MNKLVEAEWRVVPINPKYEVSEYGDVRLDDGKKMLKAHLCHGRKKVKLRHNSEVKNYSVHRLVASAFIGECPSGKECCHNDGDALNNHFSNLRYATHWENEMDKLAHGTRFRGEAHPRAKIAEHQVISIFHDTRSHRTIAREHGISPRNVFGIKHGYIWLHITQAIAAMQKGE